MSIAVIQTAFLGDGVLTLPFLVRLAEAYPKEEITLVATGPAYDLFAVALTRGLAPYAKRITLKKFDKRGAHAGWRGLRRFAQALGRPTIVFCLQRSFRSGLLAWLSGAPTRIGFSSGAASFFYTELVRRSWDAGRSEIEKNLDLLRRIHPATALWSPRQAPSLLRDTARSPVSPDSKRVGLSFGSPWATKRWPTHHAITLTQKLVREGYEVCLLGDKSSQESSAAIQAAVPSLLVQNHAGRTSVAEWVALIQNCSLIISGDSAAVHVASDLDVPVIALFGPTLPEFGFAPWRPRSVALGLDQLPCRPCHIHGPKRCPLGHHRCMQDLAPESVWDEIESMTLT